MKNTTICVYNYLGRLLTPDSKLKIATPYLRKSYLTYTTTKYNKDFPEQCFEIRY